MKTRASGCVLRGLTLILLAMLWSGCATSKIDWTARLGTYSLDQAITDFGPPDKQARLTDGSIVAEWLTRRGHNYLYGPPVYYPYWTAPHYPTYLDTFSPDHFLRLTFDAEGKLKAWKKLSR